jgi:ADP-ribose pyrophosphatase YjhB (NUDIX family)
MASAKSKLKKYFLDHVGENISREKLHEVSGNISDWPRALRQLRQETGLEIIPTQTGYVLTSKEPKFEPKIRGHISNKLRYAVLQRDNGTCQRCGANIYNTPNVKLVVDHKIPVDFGGETIIDNLWTLCEKCNGGKKSFYADYNTKEIKKIMNLNSAGKRLKAFFELKPNVVIEPSKLSTIANVRDWERTLRKIREDYSMDIQYVHPCAEYPYGGYIFNS